MDSPVIVAWGEHNDEVDVLDLGELDALLDRIAMDSDPTAPYVAIVARGEGTMSITQGPGWSIVSFAFVNGDEPFHVSLGDCRLTGGVDVLFSDEVTEQPRWSCIEPKMAREAIRHFYRTGGLTPTIMWAPSILWNSI
jgi:hypothetical protein